MRKLNKKGLKRSFPRLPKYQTKGSTDNTEKFDVLGFLKDLQYGVRMTPEMLQMQDDVIMAKTLAAYNMGPTALNRLLSNLEKEGVDVNMSLDWMSSLPKVTQSYISKIIGQDDTFNMDYDKALKANPNIYQEYYLPMRDVDAVPVDILMRQAFAESSFRPNVVSSSNAKGLTQFNDITIQEYADEMGINTKDVDPFNPRTSVAMQEWYMNKLKNRFRQAGGPAGNQQAQQQQQQAQQQTQQPSLAQQIAYLINEEGLEMQDVLDQLRIKEIPDQQIAQALMELGATEEQIVRIFQPQKTTEEKLQEDIAEDELEQAKEGKFFKKAGNFLLNAVRNNPNFLGNYNNPFLPQFNQPALAYTDAKTPSTIFGNLGQIAGKTIELGTTLGKKMNNKMTSAKKRKPLYEDAISYNINDQEYIEDPNDLDSKTMKDAMKRQGKSFESMYYKGGDLPMYQMRGELTFEEWMKQNYPNASMMDFTKAEEYQSYLDGDDDFDFSNMEFNVTGLPKETPFKDAMSKAGNAFTEASKYLVGVAGDIADIDNIIKDYQEQERIQYATADKRYGQDYMQKPDYRGEFLDGQFSESQTPFFAQNGNGEKIKRRKKIGKKFRRLDKTIRIPEEYQTDPISGAATVTQQYFDAYRKRDVESADAMKFDSERQAAEARQQFYPADKRYLQNLMRYYGIKDDIQQLNINLIDQLHGNPQAKEERELAEKEGQDLFKQYPFFVNQATGFRFMPERFEYSVPSRQGDKLFLQRKPLSDEEKATYEKRFMELATRNIPGAQTGGMIADVDSEMIAKLLAAGADIEML